MKANRWVNLVTQLVLLAQAGTKEVHISLFPNEMDKIRKLDCIVDELNRDPVSQRKVICKVTFPNDWLK